tara:strand:- start:984 stop:1271 length:288 start_codon:yes stop_codon:yes gene_type:complete
MLSPLATEILRVHKLGACSMRILLILDGATYQEDPSERWINGNILKAHPLLEDYTGSSVSRDLGVLRSLKVMRTRPTDDDARKNEYRLSMPRTMG